MLTLSRREELTKGVINVREVLDHDWRDEEGAEPVKTRTGESLEPKGCIGHVPVNRIHDLFLSHGALYAQSGGDIGRESDGLGTKIVDIRNLAHIATIQPVEKLLHQQRHDVTEKVLDWLILDD